MLIGVFVGGGAIDLRGFVPRVGVPRCRALSLLCLLLWGPCAVGCAGSVVHLLGPPPLRRLFFLELSYAIAPPAVTRELVATRVVRVNIPVLSKEEISQSAIKMEMKPNAPAGFPRSYPIRLDFAEVLGEPALKAFVRYTLDALAASSVPAPWHANAFFVRRRPVSIVRGPATRVVPLK